MMRMSSGTGMRTGQLLARPSASVHIWSTALARGQVNTAPTSALIGCPPARHELREARLSRSCLHSPRPPSAPHEILRESSQRTHHSARSAHDRVVPASSQGPCGPVSCFLAPSPAGSGAIQSIHCLQPWESLTDERAWLTIVWLFPCARRARLRSTQRAPGRACGRPAPEPARLLRAALATSMAVSRARATASMESAAAATSSVALASRAVHERLLCPGLR